MRAGPLEGVFGSRAHLLHGPGLDGGGVTGVLGGGEAVQPGIIGAGQGVTHALAGQMVADGPAAQTVFGQGVLDLLDVSGIGGGAVHVQVGGGELQSLVAHLLCQGADVLQGQVAPLNGKQRNRSCHDDNSFLTG